MTEAQKLRHTKFLQVRYWRLVGVLTSYCIRFMLMTCKSTLTAPQKALWLVLLECAKLSLLS